MAINGNTARNENAFGNAFAFGSASNNNRRGQQPDREEAKFWMNVGYSTEVPSSEVEGEMDTVFVSLPYGIPLDTQKPFELDKIRNPNMAKLRSAQNDLLRQIMQAAESLEPGQDRIVALDENTGLSVQIRRINAAAAAPADEDNGLIRTLKLV